MDQFDRERRLYERLVDDHAAGLFRVALRMTGNANDAEDMVQEAFEQAWRSIHQLRSPESGFAWLLQIMRFRYARLAKSRRKENTVSLDNPAVKLKVPGREDSTAEELENNEVLQMALNQLDDRFKLPFLLVVMEGLSVNEAASVLRIRRGTVLSRVHRAKQNLSQILERLGMSQTLYMTDSRSR